MRPDGDPERDDYGLPHVDVIVPDDARELDRDLIAYRREERQRRRKAVLRRLLRPFGRYGPAVPIIGGALLVAVLSGVLITVLGPRATPQHTTVPPSTSVRTATAQPGGIGAPLPQGAIKIDDRDARIADLQGSIVVLAPDGCRCDQAVQSLAQQAHQYDLKAFLVGSHRWTAATAAELTRMAGKPGVTAQIVKDEPGTLYSTFHGSGLTVLLVHIDGIVADIRRDVPPAGLQFTQQQLKTLTGPGQGLTPNTTPGH